MLNNKRPNLILHKAVKFKTKSSDGSSVLNGASYKVYPNAFMTEFFPGKYKVDLGGGDIIKFTTPGCTFTSTVNQQSPIGTTTRATDPSININANVTSSIFISDGLYVTYATLDANYQDGYKDFETSVPTAYLNKLKRWIYTQKTGSASSSIVNGEHTYNFPLTVKCLSVLNDFVTLDFSVKFKFSQSVQTSTGPRTSPLINAVAPGAIAFGGAAASTTA